MSDLINLASVKHKCKVLSASSSQNLVLHPPSAIIGDSKDNVWISGEGLPQQIVISLEEVDFPYQNITDIAIVCAHDYQTNPKTIQIWVAKNKESADSGEYVHWQTIEMRRKRGKQMFSISEIPQSERILKILITETYGQFQTYLNQIMLLAQPDPQTSQSLFNQDQWNKIAQTPNLKQKKRGQNTKNISKKILKSHNTQPNLVEHTPLEMLNQDDVQQIESHERHQNRNIQFDDEEEKSFQKNAALLAMSKNIVIMEDNIQQLNRKIEILQKKVAYTYQNLQTNVMKRVQEMIDRKIEKQLSQKQLIVEGPKKLKSCKQLATSRTLNNGSKYSSKEKQKKVMTLVAELNGKLKERVKLANKLQHKQRNYAKPRSQYYD